MCQHCVPRLYAGYVQIYTHTHTSRTNIRPQLIGSLNLNNDDNKATVSNGFFWLFQLNARLGIIAETPSFRGRHTFTMYVC